MIDVVFFIAGAVHGEREQGELSRHGACVQIACGKRGLGNPAIVGFEFAASDCSWANIANRCGLSVGRGVVDGEGRWLRGR